MIIRLGRRAFLVAVSFAGMVKNAVPATKIVIDKMLISIVPGFVIPVPIAILAGSQCQKRRRTDSFGKHPVVLVSVQNGSVGRERVIDGPSRWVPSRVKCCLKQEFRLGYKPIHRAVAV